MPVHGGSGKEKQTFVFWLSLCTQAVLERVPWQSLPRQRPSLQSFPLRTTPWMPWHCLKWGKDSFSPLHTPGAAGGWNCLLLLRQNWGPFCPLPAKRQLGPSLEPGNPHLSVLQPLGYKQVSSKKQHADCDDGTKHAMARGDTNQSQAHTENQQRERDKGENSLGKATSPFQSTLGSKIQMCCSYLA